MAEPAGSSATQVIRAVVGLRSVGSPHTDERRCGGSVRSSDCRSRASADRESVQAIAAERSAVSHRRSSAKHFEQPVVELDVGRRARGVVCGSSAATGRVEDGTRWADVVADRVADDRADSVVEGGRFPVVVGEADPVADDRGGEDDQQRPTAARDAQRGPSGSDRRSDSSVEDCGCRLEFVDRRSNQRAVDRADSDVGRKGRRSVDAVANEVADAGAVDRVGWRCRQRGCGGDSASRQQDGWANSWIAVVGIQQAVPRSGAVHDCGTNRERVRKLVVYVDVRGGTSGADDGTSQIADGRFDRLRLAGRAATKHVDGRADSSSELLGFRCVVADANRLADGRPTGVDSGIVVVRANPRCLTSGPHGGPSEGVERRRDRAGGADEDASRTAQRAADSIVVVLGLPSVKCDAIAVAHTAADCEHSE